MKNLIPIVICALIFSACTKEDICKRETLPPDLKVDILSLEKINEDSAELQVRIENIFHYLEDNCHCVTEAIVSGVLVIDLLEEYGTTHSGVRLKVPFDFLAAGFYDVHSTTIELPDGFSNYLLEVTGTISIGQIDNDLNNNKDSTMILGDVR